MNYQKIYDNIIKNRQDNPIKNGYTETHHIIPKCMNGTNEQENLIRVTAREHFLLHYLLTKIHPKHKGVFWAFHYMNCSTNGKRYMNSRLFASLKGKLHHTEEHKKRMSELNKGKKLSEETKKKLSESRRKNPHNESYAGKNNGMYGKHLSDDAKRKISESSKKYWAGLSEEELNEIKQERSKRMSGKNNPMYGKKLTNEHRKKVSDGLKNSLKSMTKEERKEKFGRDIRGSKNPCALVIKATFQDKTWIIKGTLQNFCKEHGLCYDSALKMAHNKWKPKTEKSLISQWKFEIITNPNL